MNKQLKNWKQIGLGVIMGRSEVADFIFMEIFHSKDVGITSILEIVTPLECWNKSNCGCLPVVPHWAPFKNLLGPFSLM